MLTTTNWEGKLRRPGDVLLVDAAVAKRWERNRLAQILEEKGKRGKDPTGAPSEEPEGEKND